LGIIPLDEEEPYRHPQRSSACTETRHTTYTLQITRSLRPVHPFLRTSPSNYKIPYFATGQTLPKMPLPLEASVPDLLHSWPHPTQRHKRHLDRFSRFCRAHGKRSLRGPPFPPQNYQFLWGSGSHLLHSSLSPPKPITQTAFRSVKPFLQGSRPCQTDRQTDRQTMHTTRSATVGRIYVGLRNTAMTPITGQRNLT